MVIIRNFFIGHGFFIGHRILLFRHANTGPWLLCHFGRSSLVVQADSRTDNSVVLLSCHTSMYGVCTEDWHYPRDVAWCDRDHASNAFLPDSGVRNSFHVVSHVCACIETLHRPLPHWRRGRYITVTLLVRHATTSSVNRRRTVLSRPICVLSTYGCVRDGRERLPPSVLSFSVIIATRTLAPHKPHATGYVTAAQRNR